MAKSTSSREWKKPSNMFVALARDDDKADERGGSGFVILADELDRVLAERTIWSESP